MVNEEFDIISKTIFTFFGMIFSLFFIGCLIAFAYLKKKYENSKSDTLFNKKNELSYKLTMIVISFLALTFVVITISIFIKLPFISMLLIPAIIVMGWMVYYSLKTGMVPVELGSFSVKKNQLIYWVCVTIYSIILLGLIYGTYLAFRG
ncbi:hypothetical protein J4444_02445 [Candidatus Woesearchaeota archaeon]|nr:hypothetical protein [Candidatus Woesearchaeota archaeon]